MNFREKPFFRGNSSEECAPVLGTRLPAAILSQGVARFSVDDTPVVAVGCRDFFVSFCEQSERKKERRSEVREGTSSFHRKHRVRLLFLSHSIEESHYSRLLTATPFFPLPRHSVVPRVAVVVVVVVVHWSTPLPARDNDIAGKEESISTRFTTPDGADVTGAKLIS